MAEGASFYGQCAVGPDARSRGGSGGMGGGAPSGGDTGPKDQPKK